MKNKSVSMFIVLILFSMFGLWQFSNGVRSVDIVGLFASGALAGAAITGLIINRNNK